MVECVARPAAWRYTARSEWSTDGESTWMRLAKFSLCNRLSVRQLMALFALEPGMPAAWGCCKPMRGT